MKLAHLCIALLLCLLGTLTAHTHFYDEADRLILSVHPNGEAVRYHYDDSDNITEIAPVAAPKAPSQLRVTRVDLTRARLHWTDNALNETGFRILRRLAGDYEWGDVIDLNPNETTYTDVGLDPKENYIYRIVALSELAEISSAYSNSVTAAGLGSAAFEMSEPIIDSSRLAFTIETETDALYIVQTSVSLKEAEWEPVPFATMPNAPVAHTSLVGNGGRIAIYVDASDEERRFYRVTKQ